MAPVRGSSYADIDAPCSAVFAVVADVESMPIWQPDLKRVRCLERDRDGRAALIYTELETAIRTAQATLLISYSEPHQVTWTMTEGNVPSFEGRWDLRRAGTRRTRAEYQVTIDFGRLGRLIRGPAAKAIEGAAVSSMPSRLKAHVESLEAAPRASRAARTRPS